MLSQNKLPLHLKIRKLCWIDQPHLTISCIDHLSFLLFKYNPSKLVCFIKHNSDLTDLQNGFFFNSTLKQSYIRSLISPTFYAKIFTHEDPKSPKNRVKASFFFALLGSALVNAACKMLLKSTPGIRYGQTKQKYQAWPNIY